MHLASLSNDSLRLVCGYLRLEDVSTLYATNNRELMRRLVHRHVYPLTFHGGAPTPQMARFLREHTSLESFILNPGFENPDLIFEFQTMLFSPETLSPTDPRILLNLSQSLLHLSIRSSLASVPTLPITDKTFATLFPRLKTLNLTGLTENSANDAVMDRLLQELPSRLEALMLLSPATIIRLEQLPTSLTALHITFAYPLCALAGYPLESPTLELMRRLDVQTPNLSVLTTLLGFPCTPPGKRGVVRAAASTVTETDNESVRVTLPPKLILPKLLTLNLIGTLIAGPELQEVIASVPSVQSLGLSFQTGLLGATQNGSDSHHSSEAQNVQPGTQTPAANRMQARATRFGQRRGVNEEVLPCAIVFPPNLTHLGVAGTSNSGSTLSLNPEFFQSMPATLSSFTLADCQIPWALRFRQGWQPFVVDDGSGRIAGPGRGHYNNPNNFPFGGQLSSLPEADDSTASPEDLVARSWASLLPRSLERLEIVTNESTHAPILPLHVSALPRSIHTLIFRNGGPMRTNSGSSKPGVPQEEGYKSVLLWPPSLTSLSFTARKLSKADALVLPSNITSLRCYTTGGWNQDDAKELLDQLPKCQVHILTKMWITDSTTTSMDISPSTDALRPEDAFEEDGTFSLLRYAHLRLAHLSSRIRADWHFSEPPIQPREFDEHDDEAPDSPRLIEPVKGIRPLTLPQHLPIKKASVPSWYEYLPQGGLITSPDPVLALLASTSNVLEINQLPAADTQAYRYRAPVADFEIAGFQKLVSINFPETPVRMLSFALLPRSLTSVCVGTEDLHSSTFPFNFEDWNSIYRPGTISDQQSGFHPPKRPMMDDSATKNTVSNLPRGLTRLDIPTCAIFPCNDGDWPKGITSLQFCAAAWEDRQVMALERRFNQKVDIVVKGTVIAFGTQRMPHMSIQEASLVEDGEGEPDSRMEIDEEVIPRVQETFDDITSVVTSLETIDMATLASVMVEPFLERGIKVKNFALPSIFVLAAPTLHTLSQGSLNRGFEVQHHPIEGDDGSSTAAEFRQAASNHLRRPILAQLDFDSKLHYQPKNGDSVSFTCFENVDIQLLASYTHLTSLMSVAEFRWEHIPLLPGTLTHLAICVASDPEPQADPFIRFPRLLQSLQLDCGSVSVITGDGISQLPPNLTTLECNLLAFNPSLIPQIPQKLTTLLFNAQKCWQDVDVLALARHMGSTLKKLSVSHCILSGALVPLESITTTYHVDLPTITRLTSERLGQKVSAIWAELSTPLTLCALDLAPESVPIGEISRTFISSEPLKALQSIDFHLAVCSLSQTLPPLIMPSSLVSLSIRTASALGTPETLSLPRTLKHFTHQILSVRGGPADDFWSHLPRGLESLSIEWAGSGSSLYERNGFSGLPISFLLAEEGIIPTKHTVRMASRVQLVLLNRLKGLPTENLHTLSLRSFSLYDDCIDDLGTSLRLLRCCDVSMPSNDIHARLPDLKIEAHAPGFWSSCPVEFGQAPEPITSQAYAAVHARLGRQEWLGSRLPATSVAAVRVGVPAARAYGLGAPEF